MLITVIIIDKLIIQFYQNVCHFLYKPICYYLIMYKRKQVEGIGKKILELFFKYRFIWDFFTHTKSKIIIIIVQKYCIRINTFRTN